MTDILQGKIAVVTGASQGIGLATVNELAAAGATVVGAARTVTDDLKAAAPSSISVDLADPDGPARLIEHAVAEHGGCDVLVNNVGAFVARTDGFTAITDEQWQQSLELNFFGAVRTIRAAVPSLTDRGGIIINVGSVNGRAPQPPVVDYSAAKAALLNLTLALAQELGPKGVQVTNVSPGPTSSPQWTEKDGFAADLAHAAGQDLDQFLTEFPEQAGLTSDRLTTPEEVASVIALIASGKVRNAQAADWIIDGGATKQL